MKFLLIIVFAFSFFKLTWAWCILFLGFNGVGIRPHAILPVVSNLNDVMFTHLVDLSVFPALIDFSTKWIFYSLILMTKETLPNYLENGYIATLLFINLVKLPRKAVGITSCMKIRCSINYRNLLLVCLADWFLFPWNKECESFQWYYPHTCMHLWL